MKHYDSLLIVQESEACSIFGGRSEDVAYVVEMIGMGIGIISKFIWKFVKLSQQSLYEMGSNGVTK